MTATERPRRSSGVRRGRLLAAVLLSGSAALPSLAQADTCYRDETGRIINRRLPGTVEVPCPTEKLTLPAAPLPAAPGAAPAASTEQAAPGERAGFDRGPPPAASPIPLPGLADYVESVPMPDRWRIVDELGYQSNLLDPYNRNPLKADKPFPANFNHPVQDLLDMDEISR